MPDDRLNITVDPAVAALLRSTGNASGYIEQVVRDRWHDWQYGLVLLQHVGWSTSEIGAAAEMLNGVLANRTLAATITVPAELGHPQRIESAIKKHELIRARWIKRIEQCSDEVVAHAVIAVVREFWTHNAAFEEALARLDDSHWKEANRKALRELRRTGWGQEGEA
jgi:hypothetical protein